jgi:hypothetical protein
VNECWSYECRLYILQPFYRNLYESIVGYRWYTTITQPIALAAARDTTAKSLASKRPQSGDAGPSSPSPSQPNEGIAVVRKVLSTLMLRRTKETIDSETGECIVTLPPRDVHYIYIDLSDVERSFYAALAKRSSSQMLGIMTRQQQLTARQGAISGKQKSALTGYAELFTLLMRLRQTCDHPVLVLNSLLEKQSLKSLLDGQKLRQGNSESATHSCCGTDSSAASNGEGNSCESSVDLTADSTNSETYDRIKTKLLSRQKGNLNTLFLNDVLKSLEASWRVPSEETTVTTEHITHSTSTPPPPLEQQECCVCFEYLATPEDTALTPCGHVLCWECAALSADKTSSCPICMQPLSRSELIPLGESRVEEDIEQWLVNEERDGDKDREMKGKGERGKKRGAEIVQGKSTEASVMRSFLAKRSSRASGAMASGAARSSDAPASNILGDINWQTSSKLLALQRELEKIFAAAAAPLLAPHETSPPLPDQQQHHKQQNKQQQQQQQQQDQKQGCGDVPDSSSKDPHRDQEHPKVSELPQRLA